MTVRVSLVQRNFFLTAEEFWKITSFGGIVQISIQTHTTYRVRNAYQLQ